MISSFQREDGTHLFLSNFYAAEVAILVPVGALNVKLEGPTVEHVYQAAKTCIRSEQYAVLACAKPGQAKRAGRQVTVREDWDFIKVDVMRQCLASKFNLENIRMGSVAAQLLRTGHQALVEGNTWGDTTWGATRDGREKDRLAMAWGDGLWGQNWLGRLLMERRQQLREMMVAYKEAQ